MSSDPVLFDVSNTAKLERSGANLVGIPNVLARVLVGRLPNCHIDEKSVVIPIRIDCKTLQFPSSRTVHVS